MTEQKIIGKIIKKNSSVANIIEEQAHDIGIDPIHLVLLKNRGFNDKFEIKKFFNNDYNEIINASQYLTNMGNAVKLIIEHIKEEKTILIYGDYDVDGTMATSILYSMLQLVKNKGSYRHNVFYYIPNRFSEGYGLHKEAIAEIEEKYNPDLYITVDLGSTNLEEIKYIKNKNKKIIITDHHIPDNRIFKYADAVLNHHIKNDTFMEKYNTPLSGSGIALMLSIQLNKVLSNILSKKQMDYFFELAGIATVADVVPLVNLNRNIVKYAMDVMENSPSNIIRILKNILGLDTVLSQDIAFQIAPMINATGRLSEAKEVVRLFGEQPSESEVKEKIVYMQMLNKERKEIEANIIERFINILDPQIIKQKRSIIIYSPEWHKGVIGIVASKLTEKFNVPSIVLTGEKDNIVGSCRSIEGFHLYEALSQCADKLVKFGGHEMAAGLTIKFEQLKDFANQFNKITSQLSNDITFEKPIDTDIFLTPIYFNDINTIKKLRQLEPFGNSFELPVFCYVDKVVDIRRLGKDTNTTKKHYSLLFEKGYSGLLFDYTSNPDLLLNRKVAFTYYPSINDYMYKIGKSDTVEMQIIINKISDNYVLQEYIVDKVKHKRIPFFSM